MKSDCGFQRLRDLLATRCLAATAGLALLTASAAIGATPLVSRPLEMEYESSTRVSSEPLTTEKIWKLDPLETNPHRQRWVVSRTLKLKNISVLEKDGKFALAPHDLVASSEIYLRGQGPWYRPMEEFPCDDQEDPRFATQAGSEIAAQKAAEAWDALLKTRQTRLALRISKIVDDTRDGAFSQLQDIFDDWLKDVEAEWLLGGKKVANAAEWKFYRNQAAQLGVCKKREEKASARLPSWREITEPPASGPQPPLLARAPARRWSGLFTVRVSMDVADKKLNGQFLLDTTSEASLISPQFMEAQGINPALLLNPRSAPQRISWAGGVAIGLPIRIIQSQVSGLTLPITEFWLMDTAIFAQPEHITTCCDGVIGMDVLRNFAVSFVPGPPTEVQFFPREGFTSPGWLWNEAYLLPTGEPASESCWAESEPMASRRKSLARLPGTLWDTGSEVSLDIHLPLVAGTRSYRNAWDLGCEMGPLAHGVRAEYPTASSLPQGSSLRLKDPATSVGMEVLGRGPFTLDLGHGRIWFTESALSKPVPLNRSGLRTNYRFNADDDRELYVQYVEPGSPAAALKSQGLSRGAIIQAVDGKPAVDLDLWEVEQRLLGAYGDTVSLKLKAGRGSKTVSLKVK